MNQRLKYNLKKLNIISLILSLACLFLLVLFLTGRVNVQLTASGFITLIILLQLNRCFVIKQQLSAGEHLRFFTKLGKTGIFLETISCFHDPRPKARHGVLLLHGFSASTSEFKRLVPELERRGVLYYAVPLTGFGLEDAEELRSVKAEQWLRDAERGYMLLSRMADEISIVAHSMGSQLALYLAARYKIKHLVLTSPYLQAKRGQEIFVRLLSLPVVSRIFMFLNPVLMKNTPADLDSIARSGRFVYTAVPVESIRQLWRLPEFLEYTKVHAEDYLTLIGQKDTTIDGEPTVKILRGINSGWRIEYFPESGHNILEDINWEEAVRRIAEFLDKG